jgi:hypothetical protein
VSGLFGNPASLAILAKRLRDVPKVTAQRIAARVAPELTSRAQESFAAGTSVYGDAWPPGAGGPYDLVDSGNTRKSIKFVSIGTIVRAKLGTPYAKYLVGKYKILPIGSSQMPTAWQEAVGAIAREEIDRVLA